MLPKRARTSRCAPAICIRNIACTAHEPATIRAAQQDFKRSVEDSGLMFRKSKDGMYCYGLRIRDDDPFPQPLTA